MPLVTSQRGDTLHPFSEVNISEVKGRSAFGFNHPSICIFVCAVRAFQTLNK